MWIPSHVTLDHHRKVQRLMRTLDIDRPKAIGLLHLLWHWCMINAPLGSLERIDPIDIATGAYWEGDAVQFFDALIDAGFIDADTLYMHDWHEYGGKRLADLKEDAARKRRGRGTAPTAEQAAMSITQDTDTGKAGPADERQFMAFFEAWWKAYPSRETESGRVVKIGKGQCQSLLRRLPANEYGPMLQAVKNYAESGQLPKDPIRFLKNDYWRDWVNPPKARKRAAATRNGNGGAQALDPSNYGPGGKFGHIFAKGNEHAEP